MKIFIIWLYSEFIEVIFPNYFVPYRKMKFYKFVDQKMQCEAKISLTESLMQYSIQSSDTNKER